MNLKKSSYFMPLALAGCVVLGILVGTFTSNHFSGNRLNIINSGSNRLNDLLHLIDDQYVDSVNMDGLVEDAIPQILSELDPHSVYISAKDVQSAQDELTGSFSGVGIEFVIRKDTIHVQNVIAGGPAENAGLIAGDKIISVDGKPFVGSEVTNEEAMRRLKGPRGTKVKIGVMRSHQSKPKYFTVTRDNITTKSINCSYMLDKTTGYIRIKNFGETTYNEMMNALADLSNRNFKNLVIDLRDNGGGYMETAIQIANEFLPKGKLIVYTEGRKQPRNEFKSDGNGSFQNIPLVVLINETSASASEILAGAIQDNDRGTVIGRRSFGKGLVQQQIPLRDGSMVRLTIARYYSPSGRCIQKPYETGKDKEYEEDLLTRYNRGEYFSQDSIKHTGPEFHTRSLGRTVYGGGGITPDLFIPEDTIGITSYYKEAAMSGLILQFAFEYTDEHRDELKTKKTSNELLAFLKRQNLLEKFASYGEKNGLQRRNLMLQKSQNLFDKYIYSRIIYNMLDEEAWMEYLNTDDPTIRATLEVFKNNAAFPKK
ncbi:MAG: S41 family peptidase [Prevotella sp.]|nr:S41 family peptidase [Prevotella sp.]